MTIKSKDPLTDIIHWCPYTDKELPKDLTSPEHIIPLALGGINSFCIPVEKQFNASAGSKIDGALANDFLTSIRRREFDARGHSNKPPLVTLRKSVFVDNERPIQITLKGKEAPLIWDPIKKSYLDEAEAIGQTISSEFKIDKNLRLKFIAKVALSAGYFIYGDLFRNNSKHCELRTTMNFDPSMDPNTFKNFGLRVYDEFSPISDADKNQSEIDRLCCELIDGSCVISIPATENIIFVIGILGKWVGTLNIPASTDDFPLYEDHDLGHVVAITGGNMTRMSYRQLVKDVYENLNKKTA